MNGRAAKNLAQSKGKSIALLVVDGIKKLKDAYEKSHKEKQDKLDTEGTESIFK